MGGGLLTASLAPACSQGAVEIQMLGTGSGAEVWFDPIGLHVPAGTTVRWRNRDPGNSHTATAYPLRIPAQAAAWNSDYLLPDETFAVVLEVEGVYDYFCKPHEHAGMVGRIVVGRPLQAPLAGGIPAVALLALPTVADIVRLGAVQAPRGGR